MQSVSVNSLGNIECRFAGILNHEPHRVHILFVIAKKGPPKDDSKRAGPITYMVVSQSKGIQTYTPKTL